MVSGVIGTLETMRSDVWRALLSVEHVAPQSPQANDLSYEPAIFTKGMVDRIGNLTILPEQLNSFIGNRSWTFKKSVFRAISIDNLDDRRSELHRLLPNASRASNKPDPEGTFSFRLFSLWEMLKGTFLRRVSSKSVVGE